MSLNIKQIISIALIICLTLTINSPSYGLSGKTLFTHQPHAQRHLNNNQGLTFAQYLIQLKKQASHAGIDMAVLTEINTLRAVSTEHTPVTDRLENELSQYPPKASSAGRINILMPDRKMGISEDELQSVYDKVRQIEERLSVQYPDTKIYVIGLDPDAMKSDNKKVKKRMIAMYCTLKERIGIGYMFLFGDNVYNPLSDDELSLKHIDRTFDQIDYMYKVGKLPKAGAGQSNTTDNKIAIIDIGCGSGIQTLAMLHKMAQLYPPDAYRPSIRIHAVDIEQVAVENTIANIMAIEGSRLERITENEYKITFQEDTLYAKMEVVIAQVEPDNPFGFKSASKDRYNIVTANLPNAADPKDIDRKLNEMQGRVDDPSARQAIINQRHVPTDVIGNVFQEIANNLSENGAAVIGALHSMLGTNILKGKGLRFDHSTAPPVQEKEERIIRVLVPDPNRFFAPDTNIPVRDLIKASSAGRMQLTPNVFEDEIKTINDKDTDIKYTSLVAYLGVCIVIIGYNKNTGVGFMTHVSPRGHLPNGSDKDKNTYLKTLLSKKPNDLGLITEPKKKRENLRFINPDDWQFAIIRSDTIPEKKGMFITSEDIIGYLTKQIKISENQITKDTDEHYKIVYLNRGGQVKCDRLDKHKSYTIYLSGSQPSKPEDPMNLDDLARARRLEQAISTAA